MSFLANWLRRRTGDGDAPTGPAASPHPLQILRLTCTVDLRTADRVYLIQETRWRSLSPDLAAYDDRLPIGAGRIERLQASLGRADLIGVSPGQAWLRLALPDAVPAGVEATQLLSAILSDPFPGSDPGLTLHPAHPARGVALTIIFPLTRPPRDLAIREAEQPDPVAPQMTPRADGRIAYVWLKPDPAPGAAYDLSWRWD